MKIQMLYEFVALAEMLNFTRAAQKMNITQPVLSRHLKLLEEMFGAELLRRDTHGVELTSSGELLFTEARKIISQYEQSLAAVHSFTGKCRRGLKIVFLGEAIQGELIRALKSFRERYPDIVIECSDCELDEAVEQLREHSCDLAFLIRPNFIENTLFEGMHIKNDALSVAVHHQHPLASRGRISLRELSPWPVIRVDPACFLMSDNYSTAFLTRYGISYRLEKEYPNLKTCCFNLEFNHEAVLLLPKHRNYLLGRHCVQLDILEDDYWFELEVVWERDNGNPCTRLFINHFRQFLQEASRESEEKCALLTS